MSDRTGGISIERLVCRRADLRITLDAPTRRLDPVARQRIDEFWARQAAGNPRLFDGPVLSCVEADAGAGALHCRRAAYRELICQPSIETGTMQVSVTGVCTMYDERDIEHVLLARRGRQTRIYAGLWELAPSGGLDPPTPTASDATAHLTGDDAWAQLMVELEEELAPFSLGDLVPYLPASDPACLCTDHVARSIDIVFPVRVPFDPGTLAGRPVAARSSGSAPAGAAVNWEYEDARWIPLGELALFDTRHAAEIIGPSRALFRFFGWV